MPLQNRAGSVFDAPTGACLVHACNAQGHWGAGVALSMRVAFPDAFNDFWQQRRKVGEAVVYNRHFAPLFSVASLVTSEHYGRHRDIPTDIVRNTRHALRALFAAHHHNFHSPKINAGLFAVPWIATETILLEELARAEAETGRRINWTVWTL